MSKLKEKIRLTRELMKDEEIEAIRRVIPEMDEAITHNIDTLAESLIEFCEPKNVPKIILNLSMETMKSTVKGEMEKVVGWQAITRRLFELLTEEEGCSGSGE